MITGIIMASGFSKRMEKDKLFLKIDGESMIERVIKAVKGSKVDEIILTYRDARIQSIGKRYNIKTIYNENAEKGQSASIKLGINAAHPRTEGYLFFVADQPYLSIDVINKVVDLFYLDAKKIIMPTYNGNRGNPVAFPLRFKRLLLNLEGDIGGRKIIADYPNEVNYINIEDSYAGCDIDTWEEYKNQVTIKRKPHDDLCSTER